MIKGVIIIFVVGLVALYGCNNPLEKSVITPLNSKELDKIISEDPSFFNTFSIIEEKNNYLFTKEDSLKWADLSYQRFNNFIKAINSSNLNNTLIESLKDNWIQSYSTNNMAVDSLICKAKQLISKNNPDSLVVIKYNGYEIEKLKNKNKIDTLVKLRLKVIPKNIEIDSLFVLYSLCKANEQPVYIYLYNGKINLIKHKRAIKDTTLIKVYPYLPDFTKEDILINDSLYTIKFKVHTIYTKESVYNLDSIKKTINPDILRIINNGNNGFIDDFNENIYREKIIRNIIDTNFISLPAYLKVEMDKYYKSLDSLAWEYYQISNEF